MDLKKCYPTLPKIYLILSYEPVTPAQEMEGLKWWVSDWFGIPATQCEHIPFCWSCSTPFVLHLIERNTVCGKSKFFPHSDEGDKYRIFFFWLASSRVTRLSYTVCHLAVRNRKQPLKYSGVHLTGTFTARQDFQHVLSWCSTAWSQGDHASSTPESSVWTVCQFQVTTFHN